MYLRKYGAKFYFMQEFSTYVALQMVVVAIRVFLHVDFSFADRLCIVSVSLRFYHVDFSLF